MPMSPQEGPEHVKGGRSRHRSSDSRDDELGDGDSSRCSRSRRSPFSKSLSSRYRPYMGSSTRVYLNGGGSSGGSRYEVNPRLTRNDLPPEDDDSATRTLYVGNLDVNLTEHDLFERFRKFGPVRSIFIKRVPPHRPRTFAFVRFENMMYAYAAKTSMHFKTLGNSQVVVGYGKLLPTSKIWIGNVDVELNTDVLVREFDRFGAITKLIHLKAEGEAYVQYETVSAAEEARRQLSGIQIEGNSKKLVIDYDEPERSRGQGDEGSSDYNCGVSFEHMNNNDDSSTCNYSTADSSAAGDYAVHTPRSEDASRTYLPGDDMDLEDVSPDEDVFETQPQQQPIYRLLDSKKDVGHRPTSGKTSLSPGNVLKYRNDITRSECSATGNINYHGSNVPKGSSTSYEAFADPRIRKRMEAQAKISDKTPKSRGNTLSSESQMYNFDF